MNKKLIRIPAFILLLLIISWSVDLFYKKVIVYDTINMRKLRQFGESNINSDILYLGDSYIQNGINPSVIGVGYNFASMNENIIQTYYKLRFVVEKYHKAPKIVIFPVDVSTFSSIKRNRLMEDYYWVKFMKYADAFRQTSDPTFLFRGFTATLFSYAGNSSDIINGLSKIGKKKGEIFDGYRPKGDDFIQPKEKPKITALHEKLYKSDSYFNPDMVLYFKKMINFCEKENIKLVFIRMPFSKYHLESLEKIIPDSVFASKVGDLIKGHESSVELLDFHNLFENNQDYFYNVDHLNDDGATELSKVLKTKLLY